MTDDEFRSELAETLNRCICAYDDGPYRDCPRHGDADAPVLAVLPVVRRFADAQVAAERKRIVAAAWLLLHRNADGSWDDHDPHNEAIEAVAARITRGQP